MTLVFQNGVSETAKQWLNETLEERISWLLEEQDEASFSPAAKSRPLLEDQEKVEAADNGGDSMEVKVSVNITGEVEEVPMIRVSS